MLSLVAVFPGFFMFEESIFYTITLIFYIISISYVGSHIRDEQESNWHHSFHIGWQYMRKVALITAVGAFLGSMIFVQNNLYDYQDGVSNIIQTLASSNSVTLSKDQIRSMINLQKESFIMSQDDFKQLVDAIYTPLTVDEYITLTYPNYDELSEEQKQSLRNNLQKMLNNPEYIAKQRELRDKKAKEMYARYMDQVKGISDKEMLVDKIYNNMKSQEYRNKMASVSKQVIMEMPLFQKMFALLPIIIGLTVFSFLLFVEILSSFIAGLVFILHYLLYKRNSYW